MTISDEAVEAAAKVTFEDLHEYEDWADVILAERAPYLCQARSALEAAAPHMLKDLRELLEDMEAQPSSEIATVKGMAFLIRNTMKGLI